MKKSFLITICGIACTSMAAAQISKGTIMLGPTVGSTSYSSATDNLDYSTGTNTNRNTSTKTFGLSLGPQAGVFLTNHFVLGGMLGYNITSRKTDVTTNSSVHAPVTANTKTTNYTLNIGPFMRYYFYNKLAKNLFYLQASGTAGTGNGTSSGNGINVNSTYVSDGKVSHIFTWNAGGGIGLTHFFTNSVGMDIGLGYGYTSTSDKNTSNTLTTNKTTDNTISTDNNYKETVKTNGITLGVGFHWFLNCKHKTTQ